MKVRCELEENFSDIDFELNVMLMVLHSRMAMLVRFLVLII